MIALSRADARRFRAVARRGCPNGRPRGPSPPVKVTAAGERLTLACHLGEVVVALRATAPRAGKGTVIIPLSAFDAFEGATGVVSLDPAAGRPSVLAQWDDGGKPRSAPIERLETHLAWPKEADCPIALAPAFVPALHEVGRSAARDPDTRRYATTRVQLKGTAGELSGTDGKQALVWGGFTFPFAGRPARPGRPPVRLEGAVRRGGRQHRPGRGLGVPGHRPLAGVAGGRPGRPVPGRPRGRSPGPARRGVTFDDRDVASLLHALPQLPAARPRAAPVTLDLGPIVGRPGPATSSVGLRPRCRSRSVPSPARRVRLAVQPRPPGPGPGPRLPGAARCRAPSGRSSSATRTATYVDRHPRPELRRRARPSRRGRRPGADRRPSSPPTPIPERSDPMPQTSETRRPTGTATPRPRRAAAGRRPGRPPGRGRGPAGRADRRRRPGPPAGGRPEAVPQGAAGHRLGRLESLKQLNLGP